MWSSLGAMDKHVVFRINDNGTGPELLQQVFMERGWIEYDETVHEEDEWTLWWRTSRFRTGEYNDLLPWQHINHYPNCTTITKKDALCRNLKKMRIIHGLSVYNFSPTAYNLPNDYTKFVSEYAKNKEQHKKDRGPLMWICKPAESSRGRGIFIFSELTDLQYDCNAVVQQYISNPLLIGGYKFDIRVYVAVPSFHPLQIYVHEEGLVRFSTEKYDLERPDNVFAHLTNTSINKFSPGYTTDKDEVGHGCKWTISQLRRYFLQNDIQDGPLWQKITNIIILTLLMQAPSAPEINGCFELYGFDILIDSSMKPWLLEVNFSPALSADCQADIIAKKAMLHDLLDLVFNADNDLNFDADMKRKLSSRDGFTDRTNASSSNTFHTSSRVPTHRTRPSGSSGTLCSDDGKRILHRGKSVRSSSIKPFNTHGLSNSSSRSNVSRNNGKGMNSVSRPGSTNGPQSSRPDSGIGTDLSQTVSNRTFSNREVSESIYGGTKSRLGRDKGQPSRAGTGTPLQIGDRHSPEYMQAKRVVSLGVKKEAKSSSHVLNSITIASEDTALQKVDSKTSTTSDSGLSSLSLGSGSENSYLNSADSKLNQVLASEESNTSVGHSNSNHRIKDGRVSVSTHHLKDLPQKLLLGDINDPDSEVELDKPFSETNTSKFNIKMVHGNIRGAGVKKIISPISSSGGQLPGKVSTGKSSKSQASKEERSSDGNNTDLRRSFRNVKAQTQSLKVYEPHPADNKRGISHKIPRNLSRAESLKFPHLFRNGVTSSPFPGLGKNMIPLLAKIPARREGNFFLVFPFNEVTHKMAHCNLDPKVVIKEIGKLSKGSESNRKNSLAKDGDESHVHIWSPITLSEID